MYTIETMPVTALQPTVSTVKLIARTVLLALAAVLALVVLLGVEVLHVDAKDDLRVFKTDIEAPAGFRMTEFPVPECYDTLLHRLFMLVTAVLGAALLGLAVVLQLATVACRGLVGNACARNTMYCLVVTGAVALTVAFVLVLVVFFSAPCAPYTPALNDVPYVSLSATVGLLPGAVVFAAAGLLVRPVTMEVQDDAEAVWKMSA